MEDNKSPEQDQDGSTTPTNSPQKTQPAHSPSTSSGKLGSPIQRNLKSFFTSVSSSVPAEAPPQDDEQSASEDEDESSSSAIVYTCDRCGVEISRFRYACEECTEVDICERCALKNNGRCPKQHKLWCYDLAPDETIKPTPTGRKPKKSGTSQQKYIEKDAESEQPITSPGHCKMGINQPTSSQVGNHTDDAAHVYDPTGVIQHKNDTAKSHPHPLTEASEGPAPPVVASEQPSSTKSRRGRKPAPQRRAKSNNIRAIEDKSTDTGGQEPGEPSVTTAEPTVNQSSTVPEVEASPGDPTERNNNGGKKKGRRGSPRQRASGKRDAEAENKESSPAQLGGSSDAISSSTEILKPQVTVQDESGPRKRLSRKAKEPSTPLPTPVAVRHGNPKKQSEDIQIKDYSSPKLVGEEPGAAPELPQADPSTSVEHSALSIDDPSGTSPTQQLLQVLPPTEDTTSQQQLQVKTEPEEAQSTSSPKRSRKKRNISTNLTVSDTNQMDGPDELEQESSLPTLRRTSDTPVDFPIPPQKLVSDVVRPVPTEAEVGSPIVSPPPASPTKRLKFLCRPQQLTPIAHVPSTDSMEQDVDIETVAEPLAPQQNVEDVLVSPAELPTRQHKPKSPRKPRASISYEPVVKGAPESSIFEVDTTLSRSSRSARRMPRTIERSPSPNYESAEIIISCDDGNLCAQRRIVGQFKVCKTCNKDLCLLCFDINKHDHLDHFVETQMAGPAALEEETQRPRRHGRKKARSKRDQRLEAEFENANDDDGDDDDTEGGPDGDLDGPSSKKTRKRKEKGAIVAASADGARGDEFGSPTKKAKKNRRAGEDAPPPEPIDLEAIAAERRERQLKERERQKEEMRTVFGSGNTSWFQRRPTAPALSLTTLISAPLLRQQPSAPLSAASLDNSFNDENSDDLDRASGGTDSLNSSICHNNTEQQPQEDAYVMFPDEDDRALLCSLDEKDESFFQQLGAASSALKPLQDRHSTASMLTDATTTLSFMSQLMSLLLSPEDKQRIEEVRTTIPTTQVGTTLQCSSTPTLVVSDGVMPLKISEGVSTTDLVAEDSDLCITEIPLLEISQPAGFDASSASERQAASIIAQPDVYQFIEGNVVRPHLEVATVLERDQAELSTCLDLQYIPPGDIHEPMDHDQAESELFQGRAASDPFIAIDAISMEDLRDEGEIPYDRSMVHEFVAVSLRKYLRDGQRRSSPDECTGSLWIDKYRPSQIKEVCGNMNWSSFIHGWLQCWQYEEMLEKNAAQPSSGATNTEFADPEGGDVDIDSGSFDSDEESSGSFSSESSNDEEVAQAAPRAPAPGYPAPFFGMTSVSPVPTPSAQPQIAEKAPARASVKEKVLNHEGWANAMIIQGQRGIGKTAAVRAVANQLGFQVITFDVTSLAAKKSRDTSVFLDNIVGEALRSHNVTKTEQKALLLFEGIDHIIHHESLFMAALKHLMQHTRRPIIFTCERTPPEFKSFPFPIVPWNMTESDVTSTVLWMSAICFCEGVPAPTTEALVRLIEYSNYDLSWCLNNLQFWAIGTREMSEEERCDELAALSSTGTSDKLAKLFPSGGTTIAQQMFCRDLLGLVFGAERVWNTFSGGFRDLFVPLITHVNVMNTQYIQKHLLADLIGLQHQWAYKLFPKMSLQILRNLTMDLDVFGPSINVEDLLIEFMSSASNLDACPLESLEVLENPLVAGDGPISSEPASDQQLQQQQQQLQQIATSGRRISSRLSERGPRPVFYDYSDDEFEDDEVFQKSPKSRSMTNLPGSHLGKKHKKRRKKNRTLDESFGPNEIFEDGYIGKVFGRGRQPRMHIAGYHAFQTELGPTYYNARRRWALDCQRLADAATMLPASLIDHVRFEYYSILANEMASYLAATTHNIVIGQWSVLAANTNGSRLAVSVEWGTVGGKLSNVIKEKLHFRLDTARLHAPMSNWGNGFLLDELNEYDHTDYGDT